MLDITPETFREPGRDRFLLSKGHGPMAYYAVLAKKGFIREVPHRLLSLGVRRDAEVRIYGEMADHDLAHGLDTGSIALSVKEFLR